MKPQEFRHFLARLGELTADQTRALASAMTGARSDAIAIIEARFGDGPYCPHCASRQVGTWGNQGNLRRFRCRDCSRTFTALTGTPLSGLHKRHVWLAYAAALVNHASVRKAAEICGLDKTTSFRWRHRFIEAPCDDKATGNERTRNRPLQAGGRRSPSQGLALKVFAPRRIVGSLRDRSA